MDMPFFIWKNENSFDNKVIVNKLPDIIKPAANIQKINIPGRNGFLTQDDGTYKETIKPVQCYASGDMDIDYICNWLNGSGEIIFSNQPDRVYEATIINQIPLSKVIKKFKAFLVQFDCQPFGYSLTNELITLTSPGSINNPGTTESEPIIKVYGSGTIVLTIGTKIITLNNVVNYVTIDSQFQDCFNDSDLKNDEMKGEFPILNTGSTNISWTGTVSKIEITPNWRYL